MEKELNSNPFVLSLWMLIGVFAATFILSLSGAPTVGYVNVWITFVGGVSIAAGYAIGLSASGTHTPGRVLRAFALFSSAMALGSFLAISAARLLG